MGRPLYSIRTILIVFAVGVAFGIVIRLPGSGNEALDVKVHSALYPQETACDDVSLTAGEGRRPPTVFVMGTPRSGTTLVYNTVRKVAEMRDPNTVSGYYTELKDRAVAFSTSAASTPLESLQSLDASLVVKIHQIPDVRKFLGSDLGGQDHGIDVVFMNVRDLRRQVLSAKRMNWNGVVTTKDLARPDFCTSVRSVPRLTAESWNNPETWVLQAKAVIACTKQLERWASDKNLVRVRYEDMPQQGTFCTEAGQKWIANLSSSIPEVGKAPSNILDLVCETLEGLIPVKCSSTMAVNPITHLHRGHIHSDHQSQEEKNGMSAIWEDDECRAWLVANGYGE